MKYNITNRDFYNFKKNGHILLEDVMKPRHLKRFRQEIQAEVREHAKTQLPLEQRDAYGKSFLQVFNLWTRNDYIKKWVTSPYLARIAANLLGVDGVRIYHDQALFKEPGGAHTPWHQDQIYWPFSGRNFVTLWMPLVDIQESMSFASGSHLWGLIDKNTISEDSNKNLAQWITSKQMPVKTYGAMRAGSATFHGGWTVHSAPPNTTPNMREVMTIIYIADGEVIDSLDNPARKRDMAKWLPQCVEGDIAASHLNPLVYKRR